MHFVSSIKMHEIVKKIIDKSSTSTSECQNLPRYNSINISGSLSPKIVFYRNIFRENSRNLTLAETMETSGKSLAAEMKANEKSHLRLPKNGPAETGHLTPRSRTTSNTSTSSSVVLSGMFINQLDTISCFFLKSLFRTIPLSEQF